MTPPVPPRPPSLTSSASKARITPAVRRKLQERTAVLYGRALERWSRRR